MHNNFYNTLETVPVFLSENSENYYSVFIFFSIHFFQYTKSDFRLFLVTYVLYQENPKQYAI